MCKRGFQKRGASFGVASLRCGVGLAVWSRLAGLVGGWLAGNHAALTKRP